MSNSKIAVLGSGLIGRSFSMLFISAGYHVSIYDKLPAQTQSAKAEIWEQLGMLEKEGLLRGDLTRQEQFKLISTTDSLEDCVKGAFFIQECVPEVLTIKREVWGEVDKLVDNSVIMASSTSALLPSAISEGLQHKNRFIVSHPTNPPYYAPATEVVPASWTDEDVKEKTVALLKKIGQEPMVLNREIYGFVLNRLQYAMMGECYRLIKEGSYRLQFNGTYTSSEPISVSCEEVYTETINNALAVLNGLGYMVSGDCDRILSGAVSGMGYLTSVTVDTTDASKVSADFMLDFDRVPGSNYELCAEYTTSYYINSAPNSLREINPSDPSLCPIINLVQDPVTNDLNFNFYSVGYYCNGQDVVSYSIDGRIVGLCSYCLEGFRANYVTLECESCPKGTYQDQLYQASCLPCPEMTSTMQNGSTSEYDCESYCEPGYEINGDVCQPCEKGSYKNNDDDVFLVCTPCETSGFTTDGLAATHPENCSIEHATLESTTSIPGLGVTTLVTKAAGDSVNTLTIVFGALAALFFVGLVVLAICLVRKRQCHGESTKGRQKGNLERPEDHLTLETVATTKTTSQNLPTSQTHDKVDHSVMRSSFAIKFGPPGPALPSAQGTRGFDVQPLEATSTGLTPTARDQHGEERNGNRGSQTGMTQVVGPHFSYLGAASEPPNLYHRIREQPTAEYVDIDALANGDYVNSEGVRAPGEFVPDPNKRGPNN